MSIELNNMTNKNKLMAMELLWDDLCHKSPNISSPTWHEDILKEREQNVKEGKGKFVDWDQAKKDIWASVT